VKETFELLRARTQKIGEALRTAPAFDGDEQRMEAFAAAMFANQMLGTLFRVGESPRDYSVAKMLVCEGLGVTEEAADVSDFDGFVELIAVVVERAESNLAEAGIALT